MSLGILLSILVGAAIGTWSQTQMMATSVTVPVMLILSFLPMFSQFNSSIAKVSKFVYSEQLSHMLSSIEHMQIEGENIIIILANVLIVTGLFVIAYHKSRLD